MRKNLLLLTLILNGCFFKPDKVNTSGVEEAMQRRQDDIEESTQVKPSSVAIINNQLVIKGSGLADVTEVRIRGHSGFDETFSIDSKSSSTLIANGLSNISFTLGSLFSLIISDAHGSTTFQVTFSLQDGAVTANKIHDMGAADGQVLMYQSGSWGPSSITGLSYKSTFDASDPLNSTPAPLGGDFYVVTTVGTYDPDGGTGTTWNLGDWAVYESNSNSWNKIPATNTITSVNGEAGAVNLNINHLTDVDT